MLLYTRSVPLNRATPEALEWAVSVCEAVSAAADIDISLWATLYGGPVNDVTFSSLVESQAEIEAAHAAIGEDRRAPERIAAGAGFVAGPVEDRLMDVIHAAGEPYRAAPPGSVASVITATVTPARFGEALAWSVEMTDLAAAATGVPTLLGRGVAGPFGQLGWLATTDGVAAAETADQALNKDPEYLAKMGEIGDLFVTGSGHRRIAQRIA